MQPPGTPTVGLAYLKAYEATGDRFYLDAATDAALAPVYGQLQSGGWTNSIDFDPKSKLVADYRNGHGHGKNNSSLDDGQTQSAIVLMVKVDKALGFKNQSIHEAAVICARCACCRHNFPTAVSLKSGPGRSKPQPVLNASYPDYDWRTEGRIKNYWEMYTLNDNVTGYVADTLIDAHQIYDGQKYLAALRQAR